MYTRLRQRYDGIKRKCMHALTYIVNIDPTRKPTTLWRSVDVDTYMDTRRHKHTHTVIINPTSVPVVLRYYAKVDAHANNHFFACRFFWFYFGLLTVFLHGACAK